MNTIPQSLAQFFQLPRGGAERTNPAPQPTVSPGKILNGATINPRVRFLNGLTGLRLPYSALRYSGSRVIVPLPQLPQL